MSNGESKIAIFKAALCCGFAIALRALFLGIVCFVVGDSVLVDCFALLARTYHCEQATTTESRHILTTT